MASSEVSEVLYSEDDISMGIHTGLDMPVECVQEVVTDSTFPMCDSQIIYGDELIVSSEDVPQSEEIVGNVDDHLVGLYDGVPVPIPNDLDSNELRKFVRKPQKLRRKHDIFDDFDSTKIRNSHGTWQQKQVSIKTLEGEFSVTMWASGVDDGMVRIYFKKYFSIPSSVCVLVRCGGLGRQPTLSRDFT